MEMFDPTIKKRTNLVYIMSIIVGLIFVISSSYAGVIYYQSCKLTKEGDKLAGSGNYSEAIKNYKLSQSKWKFSKKISSKIEEATILASDDKNYKQGEISLISKNWQVCLESFSKVTSKYSHYSTAKQNYSECQTKIQEEKTIAEEAAAAKLKADAEAKAGSEQTKKTPTVTPQSKVNSVLKTAPSAESNPTTNLTNYLQITDIRIIGDDNCRNLTYAALNLLNDKDRSALNTIKSYIGTLECAESGSGMFAWEQPPRYVVGSATLNAGTIWYAGTIVHDSWHSKLYNDYAIENNTTSVPANVWTGENAESKCLHEQYNSLSLAGADSNTLDYVKNALGTQYWEVPYNERWW